MLFDELDQAWRKRDLRAPIYLAPTFRGDSLLLGANTELARRDVEPGNADEANRTPPLLAAAYGEMLSPSALDHLVSFLDLGRMDGNPWHFRTLRGIEEVGDWDPVTRAYQMKVVQSVN